MIRKILTALILLPLAIVLVALAIANRQVIALSFDPFSATDPAYMLRAPLYLVLLGCLMIGVVIGGLAAWLKQGRWRRAARMAQADAARLRVQLARAEAERSSAPPIALPPVA